MNRAELETALVVVLNDERRKAGYGWPEAEMASVAVRRWYSFSRRSKTKKPTTANRIQDLAKGLREHFDPTHHDCKIDFIEYATILAQILDVDGNLDPELSSD